MGTARAPVAGSGDWPAWTARVANWRCCDSDIVGSFCFLLIFNHFQGCWDVGAAGIWRRVLGAPPGRPLGTAFLSLRLGWESSHPKKRNGPNPLRDPGRLASRSVAPSAFASQEPHGGVRTPYTCTWP